tara:strand:- start:1049 stop:2284 length:1236 start_codon:yes stop_codon:yes gene_type:complete
MSVIISSAVGAAATALAVGATAAGVVAIGTGANMYSATKDAKNAARAANGIQGEIDYLEDNRQQIINPYEGITDLSGMMTDLSGLKSDLSGTQSDISGMAVDLSSMATDLSDLITDTSGGISNPMANLSVATAAAEMQAEEADIALANTLDMLSATGASAGGATALAQAALQSKKGVAASIQGQEKANADSAARGEVRVQDTKMREQQRIQNAEFGEASRIQNLEISEAGRIQNIEMGEARRMQNIEMSEARRMQDVQFGEASRVQQFGINEAARIQQVGMQGEMFKYAEQDRREMQQLNRASSELLGFQAAEAQANANYAGAIGAGVGALGNIAGGLIGSDRRLKENIKLIGKSSSGLNIYSFEYINKLFGEGIWQGVMSDEIPQEAVERNKDGYDRVDYSKLDVEFKNI